MNKFLQKVAKIFLGISMAAGVGVAIGAGLKDARPVRASTYTIGFGGAAGSDQNFGSTSGSVSGILSFSCAQNQGTTAPTVNTTQKDLRLYYHSGGNGGSITLTPATDITFTGFVLTSSTSPSVKYTADSGTATSVSANSGVYTVTGLSVTSSLRIQNVNTSNTQLRIKTIAISYTTASSAITVTYDANNATSGTVPTDSHEYASGDTVTVLGNTGSLLRTNYDFSGWNTQANGQGTTYVADNTFEITQSTTLYAKWTYNGPVPDHSIKLNDAALGNSASYGSGTATYDGVSLAFDDFMSKTGQCRGNQSTATSNFTIYNTAALSANIKKIVLTYGGGTWNSVYGKTGTSSFSSSTNSGGTLMTKTAADSTFTLTIDSPAENSKFFCVYLVNGGVSGTAIAVSLDIYLDTYTIKFNANGGTGTMPDVTRGPGSYTLPSNGFTAPSGQRFAGWKAANTGSTIAAGGSYTISANVTFYAQWEVIPTDPSISLTPTSIEGYTGESFTVTATYSNLTSQFAWGSPTGDGSIDGEVTATSGTSSDGTSTFSGTLTGEGDVSLTATSTGATTRTVTFSITQTTLTLDTNSATVRQGESITLTATHNASQVGGVNWGTSNPSIATVDGGVVTVLSTATVNSTVTITATSSVDTGVSATCEVTVDKAYTNLEWNLATNSYDAEPTEDLISWSTAMVVMKNEKGTGTIVNNYIPPTQSSTRFYGGNILTITPANGVTIGKIEFTATTASFATVLGNSTWTNATTTVSNTKVTVTVTNTANAVSAVVGNTCGFTLVKVYYDVASPIVSITSNFSYLLYKGCTETITAQVLGVDVQPSLSFSSNSAAVSVDSNGEVTAEGVGTATITVSAQGATSATLELEVFSNHSGLTQNDALTSVEAIKFFNEGVASGSYYVGGTVSSIDTTYVDPDYFIDEDSFDFYAPTAGQGVDLNDIDNDIYIIGYGALTSWSAGGVGMSAPQIVSVTTPTVESISISGSMDPTTYLNNAASWDVSGFTVIATLSNGSNKDVTSQVLWSFNYAAPTSVVIPTGDSSIQIQLTITATLDETSDTTSETVTVNRNNLTSLSITNQQTEFSLGSKFSLGPNGVLKANHTSGSPTIYLDTPGVVVKLGGTIIDISTFEFSMSDNGKKIDIQYTENGRTVSLSDSSKDYTIRVVSVFIANKSMSSYGWSNEQVINEFELDSLLTVSLETSGTNKPKYYDNGSNLRTYENGGGANTTTITISLNPTYGYKLKSVTFTYTVSSNGVLYIGNTANTLASGTEYSCSGTEVSFKVGASSGTSGQVRFTAMNVKYEFDDLGEWCNNFLSTETCDNGVTQPSVDNWDACMLDFLELALYSNYSTYVKTKDSNEYGDIVEQALARYDEIISKYNTDESTPYDDTLERIDSGKISLSRHINFLTINGENTNTVAIIVIISMVSVTAIGGYFFLRKRKENI